MFTVGDATPIQLQNIVVTTPAKAISGILAESDTVNRIPAAVIAPFRIWNLCASSLSMDAWRYPYSFIIRENQSVELPVVIEPPDCRVTRQRPAEWPRSILLPAGVRAQDPFRP